MRVLYVSHSFPLASRPLSNVGGMQRVATELHDALLAHPQVRLTTRVLRSSARWNEALTAPFLARLAWEIPRLVAREGIEVVLFSSLVTAAIAPLLRRRMGRRTPLLAAIPVGRDVTLAIGAYQRFVPRILNALDVVLPISRATGAECLARGAAPERVHVVPCGADLTRFPEVDDRAATRAALLEALRARGAAVPEDALLLCSVGRHQERKGFHWFVDAVMPRLPANAVYLLAGEGPTTAEIRAATARRGVGERVRLLGQVSEELLATLYRGADLFVMPNIPVPGDIEGFGVVMLEAGLGGLPILAAGLEGIRDVVSEGNNGWLLPSGDAEAFARQVSELGRDPTRLSAMSRSARRYTVETFGWQAVVERQLKVFRDTCGTCAGGACASTSGPAPTGMPARSRE